MKPFQVGDDVYDIITQKIGKVFDIRNRTHSVIVQFKNDIKTYTCNGVFDINDDVFVRLYHLGDKPVVISIPPIPRKKVKAYKWVVKFRGDYVVTSEYYRDDKVGPVFDHIVQRIDDSMIEVDE